MSQIPPPPPPSTPPPPPPPPPPASSTPPPAPAKKSNKVLIIVLVILGILFLFVASCTVACAYGFKRAKDYGNKYEKNPEMAGVVMAVSMHPDLQIVTEDSSKGVLTVRNKKTGVVTKIDVTMIRSGDPDNVLEKLLAEPSKETAAPSAAREENASAAEAAPAPAYKEPTVSASKTSAMENALKKFPKTVPVYPGAKLLDSNTLVLGEMQSGQYVCITGDSTTKIVEFFAKKLVEAGMSIAAQSEDTNEFGPTASLTCVEGESTVSVCAETQEDGKVRLEVGFVGTPKK